MTRNKTTLWYTNLRETEILQKTEPFFLFNERQLLLGLIEVALLLLYRKKIQSSINVDAPFVKLKFLTGHQHLQGSIYHINTPSGSKYICPHQQGLQTNNINMKNIFFI